MHDIDCHIIIHKEPQWKIDRCMASFDGQAVNVHLVEGEDEPRGPRKGRLKGFAMGSAPYLCYADPDDWIEPNAFGLLNANLGQYDLIHGWENVVCGRKIVGCNKGPHHLFVLRRGLSVDYADEALSTDGVPAQKIFVIESVLYNWDIGGRYGCMG